MRLLFTTLSCFLLLFPGLCQAQGGDPFAADVPRAQVHMVSSFSKVSESTAEEIIPPVLEEEASQEEQDHTKTWYYLLLALMGGLLVGYFLWRRGSPRVFFWGLVLLSFANINGAEASSTVTAFLSSPLPDGYYSRNVESSFNQIYIRGGVVIDDTLLGLFSTAPDAVQVLLSGGINQTIPLSISDLDISDDGLQFQIPLPTSLIGSDGSAFFTLELAYPGVVYSLPLVDSGSSPAQIHLDSVAPGLTVDFPQGPSPQNTPVAVQLTCSDTGVGCLENSIDIDVQGNFCDDGAVCNTTAVRTVRICDVVDNCTEAEISVDWYDPIPPQFKGQIFGGDLYGGLRFTRDESGREWHIDGDVNRDIAAFDDYNLQLYIDEGDGSIRPHIIQSGIVILPDDWSPDPADPDLSDPTIDPTTYPNIDLWCPSEGSELIWCSVKEGDLIRNCCLLNVDENLADDFDPDVCVGSSELVLAGDRCRLLDQPCLTREGDRGRYDAAGRCYVWSCPFGFLKGQSHLGQNPDRCYFDRYFPSWVQRCGVCESGTRQCTYDCELSNEIPLHDSYCDRDTKPPNDTSTNGC